MRAFTRTSQPHGLAGTDAIVMSSIEQCCELQAVRVLGTPEASDVTVHGAELRRRVHKS
mgnify:CR=1 FL=1